MTDTAAFEAFEASGWERQATGYDAFLSEITSRTVDTLLDAAGVGRGTRLLDVATGPGHVAGLAAARGASATGIDIAESMLAIARRRWPAAEFRQADAHQLPFDDGSFDAITGNFAMLHLGRPEHAVGEFVRVLVPGGTLAVTVWDEPDRTALFEAVLAAFDASGTTPPPDIPAGPAFFRFSTDDELTALLEGQGLEQVTVTTLGFSHRIDTTEHVWNGILNGTVRTEALITRQPDAVRRRIHEAFVTNIERYRNGEHLELPVSVKMATGRAPATSAVTSAAGVQRISVTAKPASVVDAVGDDLTEHERAGLRRVDLIVGDDALVVAVAEPVDDDGVVALTDDVAQRVVDEAGLVEPGAFPRVDPHQGCGGRQQVEQCLHLCGELSGVGVLTDVVGAERDHPQIGWVAAGDVLDDVGAGIRLAAVADRDPPADLGIDRQHVQAGVGQRGPQRLHRHERDRVTDHHHRLR